ncbi:MAG: HDOD domain-containing protein [Phycisphaerales bacterium]|nr:HDOD domain-containing protein [Phycisphaerales bacterium]
MSVMTIDQIVNEANLPRLPDSAMRLIAVINDPNSGMNDIIETIRFDQTITAELLRRANAADIGAGRSITTLDDAVRVLGTGRVMRIAMAAQTPTELMKAQEGYGLSPGELWRHSVGVALMAQLLGRKLGVGNQGVLFTAGLLHDVGKTLLNTHMRKEYAHIVKLVADRKTTFLEAEQEALGFSHPEVGARLCEKWGLPDVIVRAIRYHHEPDALTEPDETVDLTHVANVICRVMGVGGGDEGLLVRANADVVSRYGLKESLFESLGAEMVMELKSIQKVFTGTGEAPDAR